MDKTEQVPALLTRAVAFPPIIRRAIAASVIVLGAMLPCAGASDTTAIQAAGTLTMTGVKSNASTAAIFAAQTITMTGVKSNASTAAIQAAGALIMTGVR